LHQGVIINPNIFNVEILTTAGMLLSNIGANEGNDSPAIATGNAADAG